MNRAERRRQQRAQRNFTAPSDRELLQLLSERGGTTVTDGRQGLLRVIPDLVRSDLDDAENVLRTAAVCYRRCGPARRCPCRTCLARRHRIGIRKRSMLVEF